MTVPWDAIAVSESHSGFAALLAGFSFAGFLLLMGSGAHAEASKSDSDSLSLARLLMFMGVILGGLSSFMYSAQIGETARIAYVGYHYGGVLLTLLAVVLIASLTLLATVRSSMSIVGPMRAALLGASIFAVFRIMFDLLEIFDVLGYGIVAATWLWAAAFYPPIALLAIEFFGADRKRHRHFAASLLFFHTPATLGYFLAFVALVTTAAHSWQIHGGTRTSMAVPVALALMLFLSSGVSWTSLVVLRAVD